MRGEMPQNTGFGEIPGQNDFRIVQDVSMETVKPQKDLSVVLGLDKEEGTAAEERKGKMSISREKSGTDKTERIKTPEQKMAELNDKMWQELDILPKVNSKNYKSIIEQVTKNLNIADKESEYEVVERVEALAHISRGLEKIGALDEEGKKITYRKLAVQDAEWMQGIGNRIKSIKERKDILKEDKEKLIENIWKGIRETYRNLDRYYKDFKKESNGYDIGNASDRIFGIRGQVAAEKECSEVAKISKQLDLGNIEVLPTTPEDDVDKQRDFILKIEYGNGFKKEFPCQVKALIYKNETAKFIMENMVVVINDEPKEIEAILESDNLSIKEIKKAMAEFRIKALDEKFEKGIFIIVPHGDATRDKGKKRKAFKLLENDGEVADDVQDKFTEQFGKYVFGVDNLKERAIIKNSKKGGSKK